MGFDYQKLKRKHSDDGSFWTSYSDLFMVLSVVFLLLYVVASLRSGTFSVQKQMELQRAVAETEDYKKQIQAYNALKDNYLEQEASKDEAKMYEDLMGKLTLLQEEATTEKSKLEQEALQNAEKAQALNQYQQMVRNIINTNLLSKKRIKNRDDLIVKKNDAIKEMDYTIQTQTEDLTEKARIISQNEQLIAKQDSDIRHKQKLLAQKKEEIASLEGEIQEKAHTIRTNHNKIAGLNADLSSKIKEIEKTYSNAKNSKADLNRKIAMMKLANAKKISELNNQTKDMQESVKNINQQLAQAETQLQDAKGKISEQEALKNKMQAEIALANANYQQQMADMKENFQNKINSERATLEGQLEKEKASAAEKSKRLGEFKDKMAAEKAALDNQLAHLKGQVDEAKNQLGKAAKEAAQAKAGLAEAKKDHDRYLASIDKLQKDKEVLSDDLKRVKEVANAKRKLAQKIADDLVKKGIIADVDKKTGDVTIDFGGHYFDTDKFALKPEMKAALQKFIPTYAKSLFEDANVAKEIQTVEIIGYSSPTYLGKYVDPQSMDEKDRIAVNYNLDLSYHRSRSIFGYIFDRKNMVFDHQKVLLPMVKVTGRSFLAEEVKGRNIASGINQREFCAKYNCEKSQKVIIRFNLKD